MKKNLGPFNTFDEMTIIFVSCWGLNLDVSSSPSEISETKAAKTQQKNQNTDTQLMRMSQLKQLFWLTKYIYMGYSKIYAYARYALCFHISGVRMSVWRSITMHNTVYFVHFNGILWFRHCIFHPKTAQTRSCGAFENQVIDVANRQSEFEVT